MFLFLEIVKKSYEASFFNNVLYLYNIYLNISFWLDYHII